VLEKMQVAGHDEIRKKLQSVLDRKPAEAQTLLRYE
jgi:hypothetical protein